MNEPRKRMAKARSPMARTEDATCDETLDNLAIGWTVFVAKIFAGQSDADIAANDLAFLHSIHIASE